MSGHNAFDVSPPTLIEGKLLPLFLKKFAMLWISTSLLVVIAAFGYWQEQRQVVLTHYRTEAQHHVEGQAQLIRRVYRLVASNMHMLSHHNDLVRAIEGKPGAKGEVTHLFSAMMEVANIYEQARLLDPAGKEVVRVQWQGGAARSVKSSAADSSLQPDEVREGLQLSPDEMRVTSLKLLRGSGSGGPARMVMRFMIPVVGRQGHSHMFGLLVLDVRGAEMLSRALAETKLAGEHLLMHAASPYWFERYNGHLRIFEKSRGDTLPQRFPGAWQRMAGHHAGQFTDAAGLFSFESVQPPDFLKRQGAMLRDWNIVSYVPNKALSAAINRQSVRIIVVAAVVVLLLGLFAWFFSMARVIRIEKERAVHRIERRSLAQLRALSNRLVRVQEEERKRVSRALHDDIGQMAVAIQTSISSAIHHCEKKDAVKVCAEMRETKRLTDLLMQTVRGYLRSLRPGYLDELGLKAALEEMCSSWHERENTSCNLTLTGEVDTLPEEVCLNVFRMVQEGLANIARHAEASKAEIVLEAKADRLELDIVDNGHGMDLSQPSDGLGLVGMRERAQVLQGEMEMESSAGQGTRIHVRIPLPTSTKERINPG